MVIAGIGLMTTTYWERIIFALLKKEFELNLAPGGNAAWGFALVSLGLIYHLTNNGFLQYVEYKTRESKEKDANKHDTEIFKKSQEILPEKSLIAFFETILSDHSYESRPGTQLQEYARFHKMPESEFIDEELRRLASNLSKNLIVLLGWIALHFWRYPKDQPSENVRYCMHPDWNDERGGDWDSIDQYDEVTEKLTSLSDDVSDSYIDYRKAVKRKLFI